MDEKKLDERPLVERLLRVQLDRLQKMLAERDASINTYADAAIRRENEIRHLTQENSRLMRDLNTCRIRDYVEAAL